MKNFSPMKQGVGDSMKMYQLTYDGMKSARNPRLQMTTRTRILYALLKRVSADRDKIAEATGLSIGELMAELTRMQNEKPSLVKGG